MSQQGLKQDGMNYAPKGKPRPVCGPGDFVFAAAALNHGHIYGMCNGLADAGGTLKWVFDPDPEAVKRFVKAFPAVQIARSLDEILADPEVHLVAGAAITSQRCELGLNVMNAGKDYFTDKAPLTSLEQLEIAKSAVARTGRKYAVYYSERIHNEAAVFAGDLVQDGVIGRVINVLGLGPHRLNAPSRPEWFFEKASYGGILCDIGSHQIEQFLFYSGSTDATVVRSHVANYAHPEYPELEDFGEASLVGNSGATDYFRVDWFTPDGLRTWGDGRTIILGTEGYIELRKYIDVARNVSGDQVYLVDKNGEQHMPVSGQVGFPYFGQLILDCLNRTESAMSQEHAFKAAELCVGAELRAVRVGIDARPV